jgi:hypothetical protein
MCGERHRSQETAIVKQLVDSLREERSGQAIFGDHDGGTDIFQQLGVDFLMIAGRIGIWNEDGRKTARGDLGDGHRARASHHQVRELVCVPHVGDETPDPGLGVESAALLHHPLVVALPALDQELDVFASCEHLESSHDRFVDRVRALTSAQHQHREPVLVESKLAERARPASLEQRRAERTAG